MVVLLVIKLFKKLMKILIGNYTTLFNNMEDTKVNDIKYDL